MIGEDVLEDLYSGESLSELSNQTLFSSTNELNCKKIISETEVERIVQNSPTINFSSPLSSPNIRGLSTTLGSPRIHNTLRKC